MNIKYLIKKAKKEYREEIESKKATLSHLNELEKLIEEDSQVEEFLSFIHSIHNECFGEINRKYNLRYLKSMYKKFRKYNQLTPYLEMLKEIISACEEFEK